MDIALVEISIIIIYSLQYIMVSIIHRNVPKIKHCDHSRTQDKTTEAAPRAVVSMSAGLTTGLPNKFAYKTLINRIYNYWTTKRSSQFEGKKNIRLQQKIPRTHDDIDS
jgi:hypothetical protein